MSAPNPKCPKLTGFGFSDLLDVLNKRARRSSRRPASQASECGGAALGDDLHRSVVAISYPAIKAQTLRFLLRGSAEKNALNPPANHDVQTGHQPLAEGVRFELTRDSSPLTVFKTAAFNRSATPPIAQLAFRQMHR
jgi:hypothetical protein